MTKNSAVQPFVTQTGQLDPQSASGKWTSVSASYWKERIEEANRTAILPFASPSTSGTPLWGESAATPPRITIYACGVCPKGPDTPGGYAAILDYEDGNETVVTGGYRRSCDERMELRAVIAGLDPLKGRYTVRLITSSGYVLKGTASYRPKHTGNTDLWTRLKGITPFQGVNFMASKSDAGNPQIERCERLALEAASEPGLPRDPHYEGPIPQPSLFGSEESPVPTLAIVP